MFESIKAVTKLVQMGCNVHFTVRSILIVESYGFALCYPIAFEFEFEFLL
jgi:hypothetical protein